MARKELPQARRGTADDEVTRGRISQADIPAYSLEMASRVPRAISDSLGKNPSRPLRVAQAMGLSPTSSGFRMLCGASIAYGFTEGGYNAETISLTALGRRLVAPVREGDDAAARREACLRPRILREYLSRYNGSRIPADNIARNVLEELGVPSDRTADTLQLILENAKSVGYLRDVKGQTYVDLETESAPTTELVSSVPEEGVARELPASEPSVTSAVQLGARRPNRVFITHGKNQDIVGQLKELLTFGGFTPVVALDNETISKPVPDKVLDEMRTCQAAVIHVGSELQLLDQEGKTHRMLNQNVLIEIGAAMALYGRKFILLVEKGATLPSNLQGLYEVRYEGGRLDYESTMKLLKAFNDFRS